MHSVVVLSVNLQNFYGDVNKNTFVSRGKNQTHFLAAEVASQAQHYRADVICTQEDEHGLALSEFDEVASACRHSSRSKEVVRTYVRRDWHKDCTFAVVEVPRSDACPMPTRCALLVALPLGITVANVFLAGGRMDDEVYFEHWGCEGSREKYIDKVLVYRPAIIVGDWNADASLEKEEEIYSLESEYVKGLLSHVHEHNKEAYREAWLQWRHSPFKVLKQKGYQKAWPLEPTSLRGNVAVDGFVYDPAQCQTEDPPQILHYMKHYTDHKGIVASFQISPHASRQALPMQTPERALSHLVRPPSKLKHETARIGVLFKALNCDLHDKTARLCFASSSSATSERQRQITAAIHVLLTGPQGLPVVDTPYTSFSGSLTEALDYGFKHEMKYIWRYCPSDTRDIHDIRSQSGVRRLNRFLPSHERKIKTHEGHKVSVSWAKWKNLDSGIGFDQVLVPRTLIQEELPRVTQVEMSDLSSDIHDILKQQNAMYWDDKERGVKSYYPQSAFLKNEAILRELVFPDAEPSDEDCVRGQSVTRIPREDRKWSDFIHSSSESEIEEDSDEAVEPASPKLAHGSHKNKHGRKSQSKKS